MSARQRLAVLVAGGLYLGGVAFLAGMMVERIRFDAHRTTIVTSLTAREQRVRARLMDLERDSLSDGRATGSADLHARDATSRSLVSPVL
jgi:hypothetical protein